MVVPIFSPQGIRPLDFRHLDGILYWPFLHFGWRHFTGNAPFCLILGFLVILRGIVDFVVVWLFGNNSLLSHLYIRFGGVVFFCLSFGYPRLDFWFIFTKGLSLAQFVGGIGIFLAGGPNTVHAGASGIITGFFGCLLLRVVFERSLVSLIWALFVAIFYGSLFYILIPSQAYSWQGHLFGFLGGVMAAGILGACHNRRAQQYKAPGPSKGHIGSDDIELTPFDDFNLDPNNSEKYSDHDAMMKEVENSMK